jgi:hypothetical protein
VKTLAREEKAWWFCEGMMYAEGLNYFIQKITLPSWSYRGSDMALRTFEVIGQALTLKRGLANAGDTFSEIDFIGDDDDLAAAVKAKRCKVTEKATKPTAIDDGDKG